MKNYLKKSVMLLVYAQFLSFISAQAQNKPFDARLEYIERYKGIAISEMERVKIPASIKLAQAILESNAGQSTLAVQANNHFGLKCHNDWNGKTYKHKDDDRDANGNIIESCFRSYKRPEDSFHGHSDFLTDPKKFGRYGHLFNLKTDDYKSWAYGLQSSGYATSQTYAESLIRVIETYKLYQYDQANAGGGMIADGGDDQGTTTIGGRKSGRVNDSKAVTSLEKETLEDIARAIGISPRNIHCYNDCQYDLGQVLPAGTRIFIQHKHAKWRGSAKTHTVAEGETMFAIAQRYGLRLENLYKMNNMQGGTQPIVGEKIVLKTSIFSGKSKNSVRTRPSSPADSPIPPATKPTTPPTIPGNTTNPNSGTTASTPGTPRPDPGTVLPPGSVYKPDDKPLFEGDGSGKVSNPTGNPTPTNPNSGSVATTGVPRPDAPQPSNPSTPSGGVGNTQGGYVPPSAPQTPAGSGVGHTVIKGDTLYNISRRYNITVAELKAMNGMTEDYIRIGQVLRVR